ncbi:cell division protein ZapD [Betaproteobacteria bacterium]|nr:cell division protein ZapD [Betaproteobacteria bacterium]GHU09996.1 cell division protein ZapD [Betaproteobacteria bacterium]
MITYEYPFNERIRTLLRLEALFDNVTHFSSLDGAAENHAALVNLFEVLDVVGRADLKMDLIQELERQRQTLLGFRNSPDISKDALSGALYEIEQASSALLALNGKFGQHLRDNDWLMSIKSRIHIPGGSCKFDLPSYHYWLNQPVATRRAALEHWTKSILPVCDALGIILRLLRSSGREEHLSALCGQYQRMLGNSGMGSNNSSGNSIASQMVRIILARGEQSVPEVSANRYAINIRFMLPPEPDCKPRACERDVEFELAFCNL